MKIIDDRGRIFGKVNIIDALVLLLTMLIIPIFIYGYQVAKYKSQLTKEAKKSYIDLEINCYFEEVSPDKIKLIAKGDKEFDDKGEPVGEILEIGQAEPFFYTINLGSGDIVSKEDENLKQVEAKLKLKTELKNEKVYYRGNELIIGLPFLFNAEKYTVKAMPVKEDKEVTLDLNVLIKDLDDEILDIIQEGDKEVDIKGKVIAEIKKIGKVEDNSMKIDLSSEGFTTATLNVKKQLYAKMRLSCRMNRGKEVFFKNIEIKNNNVFMFNTEKYSVKVIPTRYFEIPKLSIKKKFLTVKVLFDDIIPEIYKVMQEGDVEFGPEKEVKVKMVDILEVIPSKSLTIKNGQLISIENRNLQDLKVVLDILCFETEKTYFFNNSEVKMGNEINFSTDLYSIKGTITEFRVK